MSNKSPFFNPPQAYKIGSEVFRTKNDIIKRCLSLFSKYDEDESFDKIDKSFISSLITTPNVAKVYLKRNFCYNGKIRREVFVVYYSGIVEKISLYQCIHKLPSYRPKDEDVLYSLMRMAVMFAFRRAINSIIAAKRRSISYPTISEYSGKLINSNKEASIDHYDITFVECVELYVEQNNYNFQDLYVQKTNGQKDGRNEYYNVVFVDKKLIDDFIFFHNAHTHLRVVTKWENQSLLRKIHGTYR